MLISYIYVNQGGSQEGPVSSDSLPYLISVGLITAQTLISDGMDDWTPASSYPPTMGLFRATAAQGSKAARASTPALSQKESVLPKSRPSATPHISRKQTINEAAGLADVNIVAVCLKVVAGLPLLINLILLIVYSGTPDNTGLSAKILFSDQLKAQAQAASDALAFKLCLSIGLPTAIVSGLFIYGFASVLQIVRSLVLKK